MTDLVVFVEEEAARIVLDILAAKFAVNRNVQLVCHNGKSELVESYPRKIAAWCHPGDAKFLILHDRDSHPDCSLLKKDLLGRVPASRRDRTKVRIVMSELEAWYLSDPFALFKAGIISETAATNFRKKKKFRNPEMLENAKQEFLKLARGRGFSGQRLLARMIAPHLNPERSCSRSFKLVISSLRD